MTLLATTGISVTTATSNDGDLSITAGGDVSATTVSTAGLGDVEVEAASLTATMTVSSTGGDVTLTLSSADATVANLSGSTVTIAADGNDVTMTNTTADAVIVSGSADVSFGYCRRYCH